jgi:hypothetical protein
MRRAKHDTDGLLRFAVVLCAFALIFLFLSYGWNAVWIAVLFSLGILLRAAPWKARRAAVRAIIGPSRLPSPRAPPSV